MEDYTILANYYRLEQTLIEIKDNTADYSVELKNVPGDITVRDVLDVGDEIHLVSCTDFRQYIGRVTRTSGKYVHFEKQGHRIKKSDCYNITFLPNRLTIIYQHKALELLYSNAKLRERLFPTDYIRNTTSAISLDYYNENLSNNPQQREGVQNIVDNCNQQVPFVIFGPPGTGKTTVIVESILQLCKTKTNKILVTAGSNAACDEIAIRLLKVLKEIDPHQKSMFRIFSKTAEKNAANFNPDILDASNLQTGAHYYPSIPTIFRYSILIVTLSTIGRYVHAGMPVGFFTHVFIDECGASTEVESLVGISGILSETSKLIVSGDPKQLGPILKCRRAAKFGLEQSLLERLMDRRCYAKDPITNEYNRSIQARLVRNYRSHSDILHLSNFMFYDGDLEVKASPEITDWALGWAGLHCKSFPIIFESVNGTAERIKSKSLCNFKEIHSVMYYVKDLIYFGVKGRTISEKDIGIISPYKKQFTIIRSELNKRGWYGIECGSVESFQGREKPIIIASMVRSRINGPGFLDNQKRLNVLLTRAQGLLIIIGNPESLVKICGWSRVVEYCTVNNAIGNAKFTKINDDDKISICSSSFASSIQTLSIYGASTRSNKLSKSARKRRNKRLKQIGLLNQSTPDLIEFDTLSLENDRNQNLNCQLVKEVVRTDLVTDWIENISIHANSSENLSVDTRAIPKVKLKLSPNLAYFVNPLCFSPFKRPRELDTRQALQSNKEMADFIIDKMLTMPLHYNEEMNAAQQICIEGWNLAQIMDKSNEPSVIPSSSRVYPLTNFGENQSESAGQLIDFSTELNSITEQDSRSLVNAEPHNSYLKGVTDQSIFDLIDFITEPGAKTYLRQFSTEQESKTTLMDFITDHNEPHYTQQLNLFTEQNSESDLDGEVCLIDFSTDVNADAQLIDLSVKGNVDQLVELFTKFQTTDEHIESWSVDQITRQAERPKLLEISSKESPVNQGSELSIENDQTNTNVAPVCTPTMDNVINSHDDMNQLQIDKQRLTEIKTEEDSIQLQKIELDLERRTVAFRPGTSNEESAINQEIQASKRTDETTIPDANDPNDSSAITSDFDNQNENIDTQLMQGVSNQNTDNDQIVNTEDVENEIFSNPNQNPPKWNCIMC